MENKEQQKHLAKANRQLRKCLERARRDIQATLREHNCPSYADDKLTGVCDTILATLEATQTTKQEGKL